MRHQIAWLDERAGRRSWKDELSLERSIEIILRQDVKGARELLKGMKPQLAIFGNTLAMGDKQIEGVSPDDGPGTARAMIREFRDMQIPVIALLTPVNHYVVPHDYQVAGAQVIEFVPQNKQTFFEQVREYLS